MRSVVVALLITLCISFESFAQARSVRGRVTDGQGQPLVRVMVLVSDDGQRPVGHTVTEADGGFTLDLPQPKGGWEISFRLLGWGVVKMPLSQWQDGQSISLKEEAYKLKEVTKTPTKIRIEGDTLIYEAGAFRQKQDRTLADLLGKIPGLEVTADGRVQYQGKPIGKFYIEGLDLLGGAYTLATNNLEARKVKQVQVLKEHQPIQALRDISFSDRAALNIVLKDDAKSVWQFLVESGLGTTLGGRDKVLLREGRGTAMNFSSKQQNLSVLKTNNVGYDIAREVTSWSDIGQGLQRARGFTSDIKVSGVDLKAERYLFNDSHSFASHWLFGLPKSGQLRLMVSGLWDKRTVTQDSETAYRQIQGALPIISSTRAVNKHREVKGGLDYELNTPRLYLLSQLTGSIDLDDSHGVSVLDGVPQRRHRESQQMSWRHCLETIYRTPLGRKWGLTSECLYDDIPERQLILSDAMASTRLRVLDWTLGTSWGHSLGRCYIDYKLSSVYKYGALGTGVEVASDSTQTYFSWQPSIEPKLTYRGEDLSLSSECPLYLSMQSLGGYRSTWLGVDPRLALTYKFSPKLSLNLNLSQRTEFLDLKAIQAFRVFTDYNTAYQGIGKPDYTKLRNAGGRITYENPIKGFFAHVGGSYFTNHNVALYEAQLSDKVYLRRATEHRTDHTGYSLNGRISKGIGWGLLSLSLSGSHRYLSHDLLTAGGLTPFSSRSSSLTFKADYHPRRDISVEGQSTVHHSRLGMAQPSEMSSITSYFHVLKVYYMLGQWELRWEGQYTHSSDRSVSRGLFADLSLAYRDKRYEVEVWCHNLWGADEYIRRSESAEYTFVSISRLRGREWLAKVSFTF